jgi:aconitate hydratase 2/2-methylisocitrate dehydratase
VAGVAADALKKTLLMFDFFNDVADKAKAGNAKAKEVMQSWADAEWFTSRPKVEEKITVTVFKVPGETNTDDLSPAPTPGAVPTFLCTTWPCSRTRVPTRRSSPKKTASAAPCSSSKT